MRDFFSEKMLFHLRLKSMIGVISRHEQPWLQITFAYAKTHFLPHSKANNEQNGAIKPHKKKSCNLGQSKRIYNYNIMHEYSDIDFLPKSGQQCSCHLVNTHNMVSQ